MVPEICFWATSGAVVTCMLLILIIVVRGKNAKIREVKAKWINGNEVGEKLRREGNEYLSKLSSVIEEDSHNLGLAIRMFTGKALSISEERVNKWFRDSRFILEETINYNSQVSKRAAEIFLELEGKIILGIEQKSVDHKSIEIKMPKGFTKRET